MSITAFIAQIIERELEGLKKQLISYPDEQDIWTTSPSIQNSAGTLALHITGNLRHFIGAGIGKSGYIRDRTGEFSDRDIPRTELLDQLDQTIQDIKKALADINKDELDQTYPLEIGGINVNTKEWLLHLMVHFSYHLGQIDYHRRFITGNSSGLGMLAVDRLKSASKSKPSD
jgi:hypothetical protein